MNKELLGTVKITEVSLTSAIADELISLSADWEAENSCHGYRKNQFADIDGRRIFTAELEGKIIGYLFGLAEKAEKTTSIMPAGTACFEVEEIYVRPEYRSEEIGKALFEYAEQAVSADIEYIMLSTATKNWRAILHFYLEELDMEFWNARLYKKAK